MFNLLEPLERRELFSAVPGIYSDGELLTGERYAIRADVNILPAVRNALDEGRVNLEVVLDPGETYRLDPLDGSSGRVINDLYIDGDNLRFRASAEADADGSGGRAVLDVGRTETGKRKFPFHIDARGGGNLSLSGVDLLASDQAPGEFIRFVVNHGAGGVTLDNASIAPSRLPAGTTAPAAPNQPAGPDTSESSELGFGSQAGIYEDGLLLTDDAFRIEAGQNILPVLREALDSGRRDILVALDPGETYFLRPQEERGARRINDLYLAGADLRIAAIDEVDADASGGRANLVVQRDRAGVFYNPFFLDAASEGNLDLEGINLTADNRRSGEFVGFITHRGEGLVRLIDSYVEPPTRAFAGSSPEGGTTGPAAPAAPVAVTPSPAPVAPAGPLTRGVGIFLDNGRQLSDFELRAGSNILPVIRAAMDRGFTSIEVRLDPGETYFFNPTIDPNRPDRFGVANLSLNNANLRITAAASADADGSGGYARIEVGPASNGRWSNVFFQGHSGEGRLVIDGIDLTMPGRRPDNFNDFIVWRGGGELIVRDSRLSGARNNIDVSGLGGPNREGADVLIERTIIAYSNAPDRDLEFRPGETGGPANGIFARNYNTFVVNDSVFFHNGWRDDAYLNTHASAYSHGIYLSNGEREVFNPEDTRITNTIFADNGANAVQLRQGGIVRDSFFVNNPFGVNISAGEVSNSAFVSGDTVWPRDGESEEGYQRWSDRGGHAILVHHGSDIETNRLGTVTIRDNVFADAQANHRFRSPILHETDSSRPQQLRVSGNYELNWEHYQPGTPGNNYSGVGINRFNQASTELDGRFGSSFNTIDDIVAAAVNRDRGAFGADGVPEARDLVSFYQDVAREAAAS